MRVLVSGSSGLIGRAVVAALGQRGDEIVVLRRRESSGEGVPWDPAAGWVDREALRSRGSFEGVIHLAGAGIGDRRWSDARKRELIDSRVAATTALAEAVVECVGTPAVVSASAVGVYGSRADEWLDEESAPGKDFLARLCLDWERAAEPWRRGGSSVALARTGIVQSSRGGALARQLPLFRWGLGGRLGSGRQWISPISLRDEVAALLFLLDHRIDGPANLVAPEPVTNGDFTRALAAALHRPHLLTVPRGALRLALGELADGAVLASQRVRPGTLQSRGFEFRDPDIESILASALRDH